MSLNKILEELRFEKSLMKTVTMFMIFIAGFILSNMKEAYAMNVDKNLPMGNAEDIRIDGDEVHFAAQKCGSPQSMWFGFRINGAKGKKVTCVWERTNEVLGGGSLSAAVPVYRSFDNKPFKRVQASACDYQREHNRFIFRVLCESDEVHVYYCYPYGPLELDAFFSSIKDSEFVQISTLTESEDGRPCKLLEISDKKGEDKKQVWVTARAHSGEVTGSFVLEGMVRNILTNPTILKKASFYFVPFVDTDGVWLGYYGKNREPRDFNRDYCLQPIRPEIRAILKAVNSKSSGKADYSFDLHSPTPGDPAYLVPPKLSIISEDEWREYCLFAATLEEFSPQSFPVEFSEFPRRARGAVNWSDINYDMTKTTFFYRAFGAFSLTFETAYHRGEGMSGKVLEPDDWRKLGHGLTETLRAALDGKLKEIGEIEDRGIDTLSGWHLVQLPRKVKLSEVNETLEIESVKSAMGPAVGNLFIGRRVHGANAFFNGSIDEVAIYNKALSSVEIQRVMDGVSTLEAEDRHNLVLYFPFDEGRGDTVEDKSGNGNNGAVHGAKWVEGKFGKALEFNGVDSFVEVQDNDSLNPTGGLTVAAWVKVHKRIRYGGIVDKWGQDSGFKGYLLQSTLDYPIGALIGFGDAYKSIPIDDAPMDNWCHVAFVWDGKAMKAYLNGKVLEAAAKKVEAKGDSFVWIASNAVYETVSFDYKLEGTIKQCQLTLKEVGGSNALPTGRFETYNIDLDASKTSFKKRAFNMERFRVLLKINGLNGKLQIKLSSAK